MCYLPKLLYACHAGSDEGIHEEGCEGSSGRKTYLSPPDYVSPVPLPVIWYCNGYLLRIKEGLTPCTIRDKSQNEGEQVVCPVRCPGCVVNFSKRLEPDLDPVAHNLKRYHDNRTERYRQGRLQVISKELYTTHGLSGWNPVKICRWNWDGSMFQALTNHFTRGSQPVDIAREWPWLVRDSHDFEWHERRVKECLEIAARKLSKEPWWPRQPQSSHSDYDICETQWPSR